MEKTLTVPSPVDNEAETAAGAADVAQRSVPPRLVKVRFPDTRSRIEGVYQLMRHTRVVCLPNDEFVIAKAGLAILEGGEIPHEVLEESSLDETLTALRDSAAPLL
jgi:hypothetical protein